MKFSELQLTIRSFLEKKHYFFITYFFFLLGFFIVPIGHWVNNFFVLIAFPYLVTLQLKRIQLICRSSLWILSMVLSIYMCLTLLWADTPVSIDYVHYLIRSVYLFVFLSLTIELVLRYPKFIDYLFVFLCWVAAITAIISIFRFYSSYSFHTLRLVLEAKLRLVSLGAKVRNPVKGASVYCMIALVSYFHFLKSKRSSAWIYAVLSVIVLFSAALTQSRGPLGALLVTFLIGAVSTRNKKLLATVLCFIIIGGLMFFYIEGFMEMVNVRGYSYRLEIWQQTIARIKEALLFGEGISTDTKLIMADGIKVNQPHSIYFATMLYGGLIGLFLLLTLQAIALWKSFLYFLKENDFTYVALLLFAFICMIGTRHKVISRPDVLWIYFWLPIALLAAKKLSSDKAVKSFYRNEDQAKQMASQGQKVVRKKFSIEAMVDKNIKVYQHILTAGGSD